MVSSTALFRGAGLAGPFTEPFIEPFMVVLSPQTDMLLNQQFRDLPLISTEEIRVLEGRTLFKTALAGGGKLSFLLYNRTIRAIDCHFIIICLILTKLGSTSNLAGCSMNKSILLGATAYQRP